MFASEVPRKKAKHKLSSFKLLSYGNLPNIQYVTVNITRNLIYSVANNTRQQFISELQCINQILIRQSI